MKRDDMHRCRICKKLSVDDKEQRNEDGSYRCPNGCVEPFNQPPYELPLQA